MAKEKEKTVPTTDISDDIPSGYEMDLMALRHQISVADTVHKPTRPKYRVTSKPAFGNQGEEIALIYTETDSRDVWRQEWWRNKIQGGFHSRVLKYDKSGEEVIGIQPPAMADFLIAYHNACEIDGMTAWLDFPIGDPRNDNTYYSGPSGMRHTLMHFYEGVNKFEIESVLDILEARMMDYPERHVTSTMNTFATRNGYVFHINQIAKSESDAYTVDSFVDENDYILHGDVLNVDYDPTIQSCPWIYDSIMDWANGDKSRFNRILEGNFANGLLPAVKYKKWVMNFGLAGCGKSMMQDIRNIIFGSYATANIIYSHLKNPFEIGSMVGKRFAYSDELEDSVIDKSSVQIIKSLVTGVTIDGQLKYQNKRVPVRGVACICSTNHLPKVPQTEASSGNIRRRLLCINWKHVFDTGDANSTADVDWVCKFEDDETAKSYFFNLILEAVARLVANKGYTPVPEDDALALESLDCVDTIASFLSDYPVFGESWLAPHLIPYGDKYKQFAIVYPRTWNDEEAHDHYLLLQQNGAEIYDEQSCKYSKGIPYGTNVVAVGFSSEVDILYGIYLAWHLGEGTGSKGALSKISFGREMSKKGFGRFKSHSLLTKKSKWNLVPESAGINSKRAFDDYIIGLGLPKYSQAPKGYRGTNRTLTYSELASLGVESEDEIDSLDESYLKELYEAGKISNEVCDICSARIFTANLVADTKVSDTNGGE